MKKLLALFDTVWSTSGKYLVALLILTIPLYPKFPLFSIPGTYVAIRLEDFVIFFVALVWFVTHIHTLHLIKEKPIWRAFLLFWIVGLLATFTGIVLLQSVSPLLGFLNWARRIEYMVPFLLVLDMKVTKKQLRFFILCFAISVMYVFVYGFGQKYLNWPIVTTQSGEYSKGIALSYMVGGHLVSTFAGHYDMASYLILITPVFVAFAVRPEIFFNSKRKKIFLSVVLSVSSILGLWLLANAASRISIVSYFGAISLALLLIKRARYIPLVAALILIVAGTSLSLINRYESIYDVFIKKVHAADISTPLARPTPTPTLPPRVEDRSTNIRLAVEWPRAIRALTKNPLLGTGYSSITLATDNEFLRSLGEVGILGTLAFGLCLVLIIKEVIRAFFKEKHYTTKKVLAAAVIGMLAGSFLNMVFIDILEASKFAIMFWLFLGITVSHLRTTEVAL